MRAHHSLNVIREDVERYWRDEAGREFLREFLQPLLTTAESMAAIERWFEDSLPTPPDGETDV